MDEKHISNNDDAELSEISVSPTNLQEANRLHQALKSDLHLQHLSYIATKYGVTFGITIYIKGSVISGDLISHKTFMETTARSIRESYASILESNKALGEFVDNIAASFEGAAANPEDVDQADVSFIHLSNVKILLSSGLQPQSDGTQIRCRLDSIDGYTFGKFERVKAEDVAG